MEKKLKPKKTVKKVASKTLKKTASKPIIKTVNKTASKALNKTAKKTVIKEAVKTIKKVEAPSKTTSTPTKKPVQKKKIVSRKKTSKEIKQTKNEILQFEQVDLTKKLDLTKFRISIFGSARIKPDDKIYKQIFNLAKELGKKEIDLITGGGPGLMQAANDGHMAGDIKQKACSLGLTIRLPHESKNPILEVRKHFEKFSHRLDTFMALSHMVVVTPGGIGTCLELFYTLQLIQVKHINKIPIILVGKMWKKLLNWLKKSPMKAHLLDPKDLENVIYAKNNRVALKLIEKEFHKFKYTTKDKRPLNLHIYQPDK